MKDDPEVTHLGSPYDWFSIMHFKWNAFAKDATKPTIKWRNNKTMPYYYLGHGQGLSNYDKMKLNVLYNCTSHGNVLFYLVNYSQNFCANNNLLVYFRFFRDLMNSPAARRL